MKRSDFKSLLLEWNSKYVVNESDDPIDQDLDDLGNSMGLSNEDYQDEPEDYERYHKSAKMLSVDEIISALEADPLFRQKVLEELGVDYNDLPAEDGAPASIDPDLIG